MYDSYQIRYVKRSVSSCPRLRAGSEPGAHGLRSPFFRGPLGVESVRSCKHTTSLKPQLLLMSSEADLDVSSPAQHYTKSRSRDAPMEIAATEVIIVGRGDQGSLRQRILGSSLPNTYYYFEPEPKIASITSHWLIMDGG